MTTLPFRALLAAALALALAPARADEAISTDRPDFVESSDVMDAGRVQLEAGYAIERDRSAGLKSRTRSTPALLRVGLGHELEARIETDGFMQARVTQLGTGITTSQRGMSDVSLGLKWHRQDGDEKSGQPSTAWLLHVDLDSGSAAFRGQGLRPSLRYVAEWELPGDWSVGVMPGVARDSDDSGRHFLAGILAVTASTAIAPHWRGFVEVAGQRLASKSRGGSVVTFDTGLTWTLTPDLQLDLSLQRGLNRDTPDWAGAVGVSVRF
jgi:hypothetical protein